MTMQTVNLVTHSISSGNKQRRSRATAAAHSPPPVSEQHQLNSERIAFTTPFRDTQWIATTHWYSVPSEIRLPTWSRARRIVPVRSDVSLSEVDAAATPGLTLLVSHSDVWLPSETCEPVLEALVRRLEAHAAQSLTPTQAQTLEEIWIVDAFAAESLTHFVEWYLPAPSPSTNLQTFGPRWPHPCLPAQSSTLAGALGRRIVGLAIDHSAAAMTDLDVLEGLLVVRNDGTGGGDMHTWNVSVRALYMRYCGSKIPVHSAEEDQGGLRVECGKGWRHTLYSAKERKPAVRTLRCSDSKCNHCVSEALAGASRFVAQEDPERVGKRLANILLGRYGSPEDVSSSTALLFQARL